MIEYYIYSKHSNMSDVTSKFQTARVKLTYKEVPKTVFIGTAISLQYVWYNSIKYSTWFFIVIFHQTEF